MYRVDTPAPRSDERHYRCHGCGSQFSLPRDEPPSIRYEGRQPVLECPRCRDERPG